MFSSFSELQDGVNLFAFSQVLTFVMINRTRAMSDSLSNYKKSVPTFIWSATLSIDNKNSLFLFQLGEWRE